MNRSIVIKTLRPEIAGLKHGATISDMESFQNEVLRPILKFQNDVLLNIFKNHLKKQTVDYTKMDTNSRLLYVQNVIQKDLGLRNVLIGIVLGMLTKEEVDIYYIHESEYRRRISKMVIERLADQM
jgi:hypothetical protein